MILVTHLGSSKKKRRALPKSRGAYLSAMPGVYSRRGFNAKQPATGNLNKEE